MWRYMLIFFNILKLVFWKYTSRIKNVFLFFHTKLTRSFGFHYQKITELQKFLFQPQETKNKEKQVAQLPDLQQK
jgi:hypothetical protein